MEADDTSCVNGVTGFERIIDGLGLIRIFF